MATQAAVFRTCPVTGLQVHLKAERLIVANAVAAVVSLTIGGILALLLALTRWDAVHLLPQELYYRFVTAHGINMLVFWIVFFEVAGLYFGGAVLLNSRLVKPGIAWLAFLLMVVGAVMTDIIVFAGKANVMFTAYIPLEAHPLFYLGIILFAVGALIAVILFLVSVVVAKVEGRVKGSVPLVTFGLVAAAIIAVLTLLGGAITFVPAFFWRLGLIENFDPESYRVLFWNFGHSAQQINLAAMIAVWYALATLTTGAKPISEKLTRFAFLLYILFINLGSMHHLLVDPGIGGATRILNTSYLFYLAVLGSLIHAYSIPAGVEVAQRAKGFKGLFGWLIHAPWKEPGFSALVISMAIFGFIGGPTGVIQGHMQVNMIAHNTLRIPGHFHATVVAGTTLAFMGLAYYVVPLIARRQLVGKTWASLQPYIYGGGLSLLILGMLWSGMLGIPRRVWDIFQGSAIATPSYEGSGFTLALLGIGGIIAVIGGAIFVGIMLLTLFRGKPIPFQPATVAGGASATEPAPDTKQEGRGLVAPGTLVLAFVFLAYFIAMFAINLWQLGRLWPIS